jgi:hypothetical protein
MCETCDVDFPLGQYAIIFHHDHWQEKETAEQVRPR